MVSVQENSDDASRPLSTSHTFTWASPYTTAICRPPDRNPITRAGWLVWLKQQLDQAEAEGRENLQRELARAVPDVNDRGEPKWQVAIRLFSPSQSIRNRAIRSWNQRPTWIRMSAVNNDKHALDVEFTYHEVVPLQALGAMSYHAARMFVAGMNVGSMGFWWWQRAEQTTRFYRRLVDLASPNMRPDLEMQVGPKFESDRQALDDADLRRVALCFGMITRLEQPTYDAVIGPYLSGIALIAKSDLHLNFAPQASERLAACLLEAMRCLYPPPFGVLPPKEEHHVTARSRRTLGREIQLCRCGRLG